MCSTDDEQSLQHQLAGLSKADPSYATTLSDLATIKLNQGKTSEAQALLEQLRNLRLGDIAALEATNPNDRQNPVRSRSNPDPSGTATAIVDQPSGPDHGRKTAEPKSAMVTATVTVAPCLETPGCRTPSPAMNSSTASSSSTVATTPPVSRTRGLGSGGRGMGGGVALFARALGVGSGSTSGGSRSGSGARLQCGSRSSSAARSTTGSTAMPTAAATVTLNKTTEAAAAVSLAMHDLRCHTGSSTKDTSDDASVTVVAGKRSGSPTRGTMAAVSELDAPVNGNMTDKRFIASLGLGVEHTVIGPPAVAEVPPPKVTTTGSDDVAGGVIRQVPVVTQSPLASLPPPPGLAAAATTTQIIPSAVAVAEVASLTTQHSPPAVAVAAVAASLSGAAAVAAVAASSRRPSQAVAAVSAMLSGSNRSHIASAGVALMAGGGGNGDVSRGGVVAETSAGPDDSALRATLGECTHVLEVYGLTTAVRTAHLEEFVMAMAPTDGRPLPTIKWVDDEHALLVCPDGATALWMLQEDQDLFQLRPFSEASPASRAVAAAELLPPRERPKTTAAVAKKMLSHALGMSQLRDRSAEKDLAQQRKAAREARREREQKLAAAWDDD